jgi:hypothetical protein
MYFHYPPNIFLVFCHKIKKTSFRIFESRKVFVVRCNTFPYINERTTTFSCDPVPENQILMYHQMSAHQNLFRTLPDQDGKSFRYGHKKRGCYTPCFSSISSLTCFQYFGNFFLQIFICFSESRSNRFCKRFF